MKKRSFGERAKQNQTLNEVVPLKSINQPHHNQVINLRTQSMYLFSAKIQYLSINRDKKLLKLLDFRFLILVAAQQFQVKSKKTKYFVAFTPQLQELNFGYSSLETFKCSMLQRLKISTIKVSNNQFHEEGNK